MEVIDLEFPYQKVIDDYRDLLCRNIIPERYLQALRKYNALSQDDCDDINNHYVYQTGQQRAGRFLDILYTKGPVAYDHFLDLLEYENAVMFEQLTKKKARKPPPDFMEKVKKSRGSVIIPHIAFLANSLEEKCEENKSMKEEMQEMKILLDSLSLSSQKREDQVNVSAIKINKLQKRCKILKEDNKDLLVQNESLQRDKDILWKSCLEHKKETDSYQQRCQQYMIERDASNDKYNRLKLDRDAVQIDVSRLRDKWTNERERSIRLQKSCDSAPRLTEVQTLRTENEQLKQKLAQLETSYEALFSNSTVGLDSKQETKIAILEEQLQETLAHSSQSGQDLCQARQQLHDVESEKIKMSERLSEVELNMKNMSEEIQTFKRQGIELRTQLKKIKSERDEAITQRNKAQQECCDIVKERDLLVDEKHDTQMYVDGVNRQIKQKNLDVAKLEKQLVALSGNMARKSADSGEFSMDISEDDLLSDSSESLPCLPPDNRSSMLPHVSNSIRKNQPRLVDDDDLVTDERNVFGEEMTQSSSSPEQEHGWRRSKSEDYPKGPLLYSRTNSLPASNPSVYSKQRTPKNSFSERQVCVPARFLQDFVEIRGEVLMGIYIVCANTRSHPYDLRKMDQILQIECFDENRHRVCLNLKEQGNVSQDRVRYMVMCADPESEVHLSVVNNPTGFHHLQTVTEKVKIIANPFFIRSNLTLSGQAEGYLNIEQDSLLKVLHNAMTRCDKYGNVVVDRYGMPEYDWFACKIDKTTGDAHQFGLIPSEDSANRMLEKKKGRQSHLKLLARGTLAWGKTGSVGAAKEVAYTRVQQYKKLLVIYGPSQLKYMVQNELQLSHDFQECKLEYQSCTAEDLPMLVLNHDVLHYVKCGLNFSVMTTESVKELALNFFGIADVGVDDIQTFSSRLQQSGLGVNVVLLKPSRLATANTLWYDIFYGNDDILHEIENLEKIEEKLLTGQSHDCVPVQDLKTLDDLIAKIVWICNQEPYSKLTI